MKPLPATVRSTALVQQTVIAGRVLDSLTGQAPAAPVLVRLIDRDSGQEYPLASASQPDGAFAFFAQPETAFPRLASHTYRLRIEASAARYVTAAFDFVAGPAAGQPAAVSIAVPTPGIAPIPTRLFTGGGLPRVGISLSLNREPVRLAGRVVVSTEPATGVTGATVQQFPPLGPSVVAGAHGRFQFPDPLPVALAIPLRVSAFDHETTTLTFEPDYSQPINRITVLLKRS